MCYRLRYGNWAAAFLYNPLENEVCKECTLRDDCYKEAMMIYPIKNEDRILGTVALSSFTPEKKLRQKIIENDLKFFMLNISNFLALKIREQELLQRYQITLNSIDEGIVLTDYKGIVLFLNEKMNKFISIGDKIDSIFVNHSIDEITKYGKGYENKESENPAGSDDKMFISAKPIVENDSETEILFVLRNYDFNNLIDKSMLEYSYGSKYLRTIIGNSKLINNAKDIAIKASQSNSNVLIRGESGTGKEVFARAIHNMSKNREGKFVAVNCAAIPDNLLESELFGYEDGAFTGAKKGGKPGLFELANEGTIFLDELGDLPIHLQPKLLRAIENKSIIRVGGTIPIKINARIIAATNRNLEKDIEEGKFRKDLYYRLNVIPVCLPPLRNIPEDILTLARYFLNKYTLRFSKEITEFSKEVENIFLTYDWPGNVRELENIVEYIVNVENSSTVQVTCLPDNLKKFSLVTKRSSSDMNLKNTERQFIQELLRKYESDVDGKIKVAKELGISLSTLYRKLKSFNI